jgi:hypothetical protein
MNFSDFLKQEENVITEIKSKWQKKHQSLGHKVKKAVSKKRHSKTKKASKELKRLSGISAKREIKDELAKTLYRNKFTDLSQDQKDTVNEKMKQNINRQKIIKRTQEKFIERQKKQKEKAQKELEKQETERAKEHKKTEKEKQTKKKEHEKREEEKFQKKLQ